MAGDRDAYDAALAHFHRRASIKTSHLLCCLLLISGTTAADSFSGRIASISDGDTLILADTTGQAHRIRLLGIDAPEIGQDFAQKSRSSLSAMSFGRQASANCPKRDRQGREVCQILVDGKDIGLEQLRLGMAWRYLLDMAELTSLQNTDYQHAEFTAKIHRLGFWNSKNPMPPWDWRRD